MSIIDEGFDSEPWDCHVGPDIAENDPEEYDATVWPDCTRFRMVGSLPYAGWLAAQHRPILPNSGHLKLTFDLRTDGRALDQAQAIEFDTRISFAGWNYNCSAQLEYFKGGRLQLSRQDGSWEDTDYVPGKLVPDMWHAVECRYRFDVKTRVYQTEFVRIDDGTGASLERFQGDPANSLTAEELDWDDSCNLQIQQVVRAEGGAFTIYTRQARYEWT